MSGGGPHPLQEQDSALLHQRLIPAPKSDLFSKTNLAWLAPLPLENAGREALRRQLQLLAFTEELIGEVTDSLAASAWSDPRIKLLMTMPGVDFTIAQTLLSALHDIARFQSADKAAAYLGLVPSTYQSGDNCYRVRQSDGRFSPTGNLNRFARRTRCCKNRSKEGRSMSSRIPFQAVPE